MNAQFKRMPTKMRFKFSLSLFSIFFLLLINIQLPESTLALSIQEWKELKKIELKLSQNLANWQNSPDNCSHANKLQKPLTAILTDLPGKLGQESVNTKYVNNQDFIASQNPICVYKMLWKIKLLLENFSSHDFFPNFGESSRDLLLFLWKHGWPQIKPSIKNVFTLQQIYDLYAEQISDSKIFSLRTNYSLNSLNFYEIGIHALKTKFSHFLPLLIQHDEDFPTNRLEDFHVFGKSLSKTHFPSQKITRRSVENEIVEKNFSINKYYDNKLWRVCSGKSTQTAAEKSKLFCWYETEIHKTYKIGPIRAELFTLGNVSQVIQYHDVLGDKVIEQMKTFLLDKTKHQQITDTPFDPFESHVLYRPDENFKLNFTIFAMNLIERLTGYKKVYKSISTNAHYYVYGVGAARGRHYENAEHAQNPLVATFVFYLNNVEKGGETVFPRLKLKVAPKRGSMLVWVNSYSDGVVDKNIEHGSCPVVFGEKWIFAPDVSYADQNHLTCNLKRNTPYPVLVNGKLRK